MKLKEIKITDYNKLDPTVVGYYNSPLRITEKDGYSCISNTSDNVYRGFTFTPLVKKIEFWGKQVINGSNWYNFFNIGIKFNKNGSEENHSWLLVNSSSTGIRWQSYPDTPVPNYSLNVWYHWTFYLDEDNSPWYEMKDEEGNLLYRCALTVTRPPVIQFNHLSVVCPYQSDISYLRDISVYVEDTSSSEFLSKEGLTKVWEQIGKKYYSKEEINTKLSNAGIIPNTTVISMDNYVDITNTFNSSMDTTIIPYYYTVIWEPTQDGWLTLNIDTTTNQRILVECLLSDTVSIRLFDLSSSYVAYTVPIQKNKKYRIITQISSYNRVIFIPNIISSAGDNNEIITARNTLFSFPTPTSLVEDEEGTVYTLTDKTVLGE